MEGNIDLSNDIAYIQVAIANDYAWNSDRIQAWLQRAYNLNSDPMFPPPWSSYREMPTSALLALSKALQGARP